MSAVILSFPRTTPVRTLLAESTKGDFPCAGSSPQGVEVTAKVYDFLVKSHHLAPFSPAWCVQHLPLIEAAAELMTADEGEFARRCALMQNADGRAMVDELAGQLERLGECLATVGDTLDFTAERIRQVMFAQL